MVPLKIRILLADDHLVVRRGLRMVLDAEPDLVVAAEAADGREAVQLGVSEPVHLAILDVSMPRMTGLAGGARVGPTPTKGGARSRSCCSLSPATS